MDNRPITRDALDLAPGIMRRDGPMAFFFVLTGDFYGDLMVI